MYEIQSAVKKIIADKLEEHYGKNWLIQALPRGIYENAKKEADDQNYESIRLGHEGTVTIWDCVSLLECKTIATTGNHWTLIFESVLTRPEESESGNKETRTNWLLQMQTINNKLSMPSYSVSTKDFELIKSIYDWLNKK